MASKSCFLVEPEPDNRFAVYCGDGVYVQSVNTAKHYEFVNTGPLDGAFAVSRRIAIAALHTARRAGLNAWLVQHPETAGAA